MVTISALGCGYCGVPLWSRIVVCRQEQQMADFISEHAISPSSRILRVDFCLDVVYYERYGRLRTRGSASNHADETHCGQLIYLLALGAKRRPIRSIWRVDNNGPK